MSNSQQQFIADMYPAARKVSDETGLSWELILAQAATETGWGQKVLPGTNNLYNIKADSSWQGETKTFSVKEYDKAGNAYVSDEKFRVYGSYEESLRDRIAFLEKNPRYAQAGMYDPGVKGNLEKEAQALQKAGYATNPDYASDMIELARGPTMAAGIALAEGREANTASHVGVLRAGMTGESVTALQTSLRNLGYKDAAGNDLRTDGQFGANTDYALKTFQREHGLHTDGIAGPHTMQTIGKAEATPLSPAERPAYMTLTDPAHQAYAMYEQARAGVRKLDQEHGRAPTIQSDQLAGSLAASALASNMSRIDYVALSDDANRIYAVQGAKTSPFKTVAEADVVRGLQTPISESSQVANEHLSRTARDQAMQQVNAPAQTQAAPQFNGPSL